MKAILMLFTALGIPLAILNMLGGVVSGIWLATLGEWGSIGYGILAMVVSGFALGIALMPSIIFAAPAAYFAEKGIMFLFYIFAFPSSIYVVALMTTWCGAVLYFFAMRATSDTWIPILNGSYGVALGPRQWMAQKDAQGGGGEASMASTFFAQVGYVVMIFMAIFMRVTIADLLSVFIVIMLIGVFFQCALAVQCMRATKASVPPYDEFDDA